MSNIPGTRIVKGDDRIKYIVIAGGDGITATLTAVMDEAELQKHIKGFCQEASIMSREEYVPCLGPAVAIIRNRDGFYRMCASCTDHNVRNRGAIVEVEYRPAPEYCAGNAQEEATCRAAGICRREIACNH